MDESTGWIKIHRSLLQWEWFDDAETLRVFLYLLLSANYEDKKWRGIVVRRGELVIGREKTAEQLNLTVQKLRTRLQRLEECGTIALKTTNKYTILSICNYDTYQDAQGWDQPTNNQQITNKQPTNNQQITTTKEYKEDKNIRMYSSSGEEEYSAKNPESIEDEDEEDTSVAVKVDPIDYKKVADYWNANVPDTLPRVTVTSKRRKAEIRARVKETSEEEVLQMIDEVAKSDFLLGKNNRGWRASFDWCLKPSNFAKVLDGNYRNNDKTDGYGAETERRTDSSEGCDYTKWRSMSEYLDAHQDGR